MFCISVFCSYCDGSSASGNQRESCSITKSLPFSPRAPVKAVVSRIFLTPPGIIKVKDTASIGNFQSSPVTFRKISSRLSRNRTWFVVLYRIAYTCSPRGAFSFSLPIYRNVVVSGRFCIGNRFPVKGDCFKNDAARNNKTMHTCRYGLHVWARLCNCRSSCCGLRCQTHVPNTRQGKG